MNKELSKRAKKILSLIVGSIFVFSIVFFVVWPKIGTHAVSISDQKVKSLSAEEVKTAPDKEIVKEKILGDACITNKEQALKILLEKDKPSETTETAIASYKREVETRGNKVFFDEYSDGLDDTPSIMYLNIGEELKNGSKLLHARYSYRVDACDIDLEKEDIDLAEYEKYLGFSFANSAGTKDQFVDESITCYSDGPTTELADINGDRQDETIVDCSNGGSSSASFRVFVYKLENNKINQIGQLDSEGMRDIKDCNADGVQDIVTYIRDIPHGNGSNAEMTRELFCNHWDKKTSKFVETKIGEE